MKLIVPVVIAALTFGCSGAPTAPSNTAGLTGTVLTTQDDRPADHTPGWRKATIFFWAPELPEYGHEHLVGLPVTLVGMPSGQTYQMETGRQGTVSADFPRTDTELLVMPAAWNGWCIVEGTVPQVVPLPYVPRENWVHMGTGNCVNP